MAIGYSYPVKTLQPGVSVVEGNFRPNGSSDVNSAYFVPSAASGFTVARKDVGVFDITFDSHILLIAADVWLAQETASSTDQVVQIVSWSASTNILKIQVYDISAGTACDIASNSDRKIHFMAIFKDRN